MTRLTLAVLSLAAVLALPQAGIAENDPTPVKVLFETRQLDLIDRGQEVVYAYNRKGSNAKMVGEDYADKIRLGVAKVGPKGERDVVFKVFSGQFARDPQSWPELSINPLFIWYLDRSVATFRSLAGGNQMYLKGQFRSALGNKAKVEKTKVTFNGKEIDGYKVTVTPYADDRNAHKMQGFENALFTIIVSKDAPGYFVDLKAEYESKNAGGPTLTEQIKLENKGDAK